MWFRGGFGRRNSGASSPFFGLILGSELGCQLADGLAVNDSVCALLVELAGDVDGQLRRAGEGQCVEVGLDICRGDFVVWVHGGWDVLVVGFYFKTETKSE